MEFPSPQVLSIPPLPPPPHSPFGVAGLMMHENVKINNYNYTAHNDFFMKVSYVHKYTSEWLSHCSSVHGRAPTTASVWEHSTLDTVLK